MNSTKLFQSIKNISSKARLLYSIDAALKERIELLVKDKKVVVFMKGIPSSPQCGFSNAVVKILDLHGVKDFDSYNVLEDQDLRQGIKEYSDWPTIPQVFLNGEFLGGCDLMLEMHKNGDLIKELNSVGIKSALENDEPATDKN